MSTLLKEISVGSASGVTWYLRLYEDSVSQSVANNQSKITLRLTLRASNSNYSISFDTRDAWIGSTHFTMAYTQSGSEHNLGSTTITVNHGSDGTGSYSYSFGIKTSFALNGSGTGSRSLTTIPRASSIGTISGSTLGSAVTVNIDRKSTSFTHTVTYKFGSITRSYTGQGVSCSFTPPLSDASAIPNATSGTATVTVQTYSGSTAIGSAVSKSFTLNLPASAVPSISGPSISRVDNGVPASWGIYVRYFSKANVSISGGGVYGSSVSAYSISGGGYSSNSSSLTTDTLNTPGTMTFTGTVRDSRGRTKSASASITIVDYWWPAASITAERCNSNGTANPDGVYVKVIASFSYAPVSSKNGISSKKIEILGTSYTNTSFTSGTAVVMGGAVSVDKSYTIKVTVTDSLGQSASAQTTISTGQVTVDYKSGGKGVAFGKVAETDNQLESAWLIKTPKLSVTSIEWGAISCAGNIYTPSSVQIDGGGWIGKQAFNGEWIGFYNGVGGTRKGWIGHDGSTNFYINNSAGGKVVIGEASLLVKNDGSVMCNNTSGIAKHLIGISSSNNVYVGDSEGGTESTNIYSGHNIAFRSNKNSASYKGYALNFSREQSGSYRTILRPEDSGGVIWLGSTGYRFNTGFFTNAITASDLKEKKVLSDFDMKAKDFIMALKPIAYNRIGNGDNGKRVHYGFGAQTVANTIKNMNIGDLSIVQASIINSDGTESPYVKGTPDELLSWGINYNEFIAPIVATIQQQQKDIEKLSDKLFKLEELVGTLVNR